MLAAFAAASLALVSAAVAPAAPAAASAVITVTSASDVAVTDGQCTLREAIANVDTGGDTTGGDCAAGSGAGDIVRFEIPASGRAVIGLLSDLPAITSPVVLDGATQSGFVANTTVSPAPLDGQLSVAINGQGHGCLLASSTHDVAIRGLSVGGCVGTTVHASGVIGFTVTGSYVGTDPSGSGPSSPATVGNAVLVDGGSADTVIGGTDAADRNILAGASGSGLMLNGVAGGTVQGNYVGVGADGETAVANQSDGIQLANSSSGYTLGGSISGGANVVSGNLGEGIEISGGTNRVEGNLVGVDALGGTAVPNGAVGVFVEHSAGSAIIGNVLSGNFLNGITLEGASSDSVVRGNLIGLDVSGTAAIPNGPTVSPLLGGSGIEVSQGSHDNAIGGVSHGDGNVISGNPMAITFDDAGTQGNTVQGNLIGTDRTGSHAVPNHGGVAIQGEALHNLIGGVTPGARNVIAATDRGAGVHINIASFNTIEGNYIGVAADGVTPMGNEVGVAIDNSYVEEGTGQTIVGVATDNVVGGTSAGAPNVIVNSPIAGILIDTGVLRTAVLGNRIGVSADGATAMANGIGVDITDTASDTTIGGEGGGAGNLISGNTGAGVLVRASAAGTVVQGNRIGTNADGGTAIPNGTGVQVQDSASATTIGGPDAAAGNLISGNPTGVSVSADGTTLEANLIGTTADGVGALGNGFGIYVSGAHGIQFGCPAGAGCGNVVAESAASGLVFLGGASGNVVQGNRFRHNGAGVVLVGDVSSNLVGGVDPGNGNDLSDNFGPGVSVVEAWYYGLYPTSNPILGNTYEDNGDGSIDRMASNRPTMVPDSLYGPTPNDTPGTHDLQNTPVITSATYSAGDAGGPAHVTVTFDFHPKATSEVPAPAGYRIELYGATDAANGRVLLGATTVAGDVEAATETFVLPEEMGLVDVMASATGVLDATTYGSTSEMAPGVAIADLPPGGPPPTTPGFGSTDSPLSVRYGQPMDLDVRAGAVPSNVGVLSFGQGAHGAVSEDLATGHLTYTPTGHTLGADSYTYVLTDVYGQTVEGTVQVDVALPVAPTAGTGGAGTPTGTPIAPVTTPYRTPVTLDALGASAGFELSVTSVSQGAHGSVDASSGNPVYSPAPLFAGSDSFTYTVTDSFGQSSTATAYVQVSPPAAPTAPDYTESVHGPGQLVVAPPGVLDSATGVGNTLTAHSTPEHGSLIIGSNGAYTYAPDLGYAGDDSFTYTVTDAFGRSATGTVRLTVLKPDAPAAVDFGITTAYGTVVSVGAPGVLAGATGTGVRVTASTAPAHGSASVSQDGSFSYTPATGFAGPDSFTFTVTDAYGQSASAAVHVTVSLPAAPAVADSNLSAVYQTPSVVAAPGVLAGSTGVGVSVTSYTAPSTGSVSVASDGSFTYTPADGYVGSDSFTFTATDLFGQTAQGTVTVAVTAAGTVTVLRASPGPSTFGQLVELTATVTSSAGTPAGSVRFYNGATFLGSSPLLSGAASLTTTALPVGIDHLTATYTPSGAVHQASTSDEVRQQVGPVSTATALSSSANPSTPGQMVTFVATVAGPGGTPTGTVVFSDGTSTLGSALVDGSGRAALPIATLNLGSHSIVATYWPSGSGYLGSTSSALVQAVSPSIAGTVTDISTQQPVGGATVTLWVSGSTGVNPTAAATTTTDAGGHYSFGSVAAGVYQLSVARSASYITNWWGNAPAAATAPKFVVATGAPFQADVLLTPLPVLSGSVTNSSTGLGIAGAIVMVFRADGSYTSLQATTSAGGNWSMPVPAGQFKVLAVAPGYANHWYNGSSDPGTAPAVTQYPSGTSLGILPLSAAISAGVTIAGTVTDSVTRQPVAGVNVRLWQQYTQSYVSTTTDATGAYRLPNLPAGYFQLQFAKAGSYLTSWWSSATAQANAVIIATRPGDNLAFSPLLVHS